MCRLLIPVEIPAYNMGMNENNSWCKDCGTEKNLVIFSEAPKVVLCTECAMWRDSTIDKR